MASHPARVEELTEFLVFDFDAESTPTLQEDWHEEDLAHAVLSTCSSLRAIVDVCGSSVIQIPHFFVKGCLTSKCPAEAKDAISQFHISKTAAHTIVAQACLGVLLHVDENITKGGLKEFRPAEGVSLNIKDGTRMAILRSGSGFTIQNHSITDTKEPDACHRRGQLPCITRPFVSYMTLSNC